MTNRKTAPAAAVAPKTARGARPAAKADAAKTRAPRAPRAVAWSLAISPRMGEFEAPVSLGNVVMSRFDNPTDFAETVVAGTLALAHSDTKVTVRECGQLSGGKHAVYGAMMRGSFGDVRLVFGPAAAVAAFIAETPEAAPAPAPAPTAAPAVAREARATVAPAPAPVVAPAPTFKLQLDIGDHGEFVTISYADASFANSAECARHDVATLVALIEGEEACTFIKFEEPGSAAPRGARCAVYNLGSGVNFRAVRVAMWPVVGEWPHRVETNAPALPPKTKPADAAARKASSAEAHPARPALVSRPATMLVTVTSLVGGEPHGMPIKLTAPRGDMTDCTVYLRDIVGPLVRVALSWSRVSLETAPNVTNAARGEHVCRMAGGKGQRAMVTIAPGALPDTPVAPLNASAARVDRLASLAGIVAPPAPARGARPAGTGTAAVAKPDAAPRMTAKYRDMLAACEAGKLPPVPDFSKDTHTRYRPRLAELVKLVKAGDADAVQRFADNVQPISTSPKAIKRYGDFAAIALRAKAAKAARS